MLPVLDAFSSSIHSGLWLQYFSFQRHPNGRNSINIQGSALEKIMVREYILSLKRSKLFPSRLFSSVTYSTGFSPPEKAAMEHLQGDMKTKKSFLQTFLCLIRVRSQVHQKTGAANKTQPHLLSNYLKEEIKACGFPLKLLIGIGCGYCSSDVFCGCGLLCATLSLFSVSF